MQYDVDHESTPNPNHRTVRLAEWQLLSIA